MTLLFESSFETAGFPEWDNKTDGEQVTDPVQHLTYAVRATTDNFDFIEDFGGSQKLLYLRFFIRWSNLQTPASTIEIAKIYGSSGDSINLYLYYSGGNPVFYFWTADLGGQTCSTVLQSDRWYCIEIRAQVDTSSTCRLWIDGSVEATLTGDNDQAQPLDTIEFLATYKDNKYDEQYLDWVMVDTESIGCTLPPLASCDCKDWENGGFEAGDFTLWTVTGDVTIEGDEAVRKYGYHYAEFNAQNAKLEYELPFIPTDEITECSVYVYGKTADSTREIIIYYDDGTSTIINHANSVDGWEEVDLLSSLSVGKSVIKIAITRTDSTANVNALDCCILDGGTGVWKIWHVYVGDIERQWISIDFDKIHPSANPDVFEVTLGGNQKAYLNYFDPVKIYKEDTTGTKILKFYGYVEKINILADEGGLVTKISGRCRKVLLWKKFTERFSDPKLEAFFGLVYPHELFKFLLRCPKSTIPDEGIPWEIRDYSLCKIGWGLNPRDWNNVASSSAIGTHPIYPTLRMQDFYWRNRGLEHAEVMRAPNATYGSMQWTEDNCSGASCLASERDDKEIYESSNNQTSYEYGFEDLPPEATGINKVNFRLRCRADWTDLWVNTTVKVTMYISPDNGTSWHAVGDLAFRCKHLVLQKDWEYLDYDVTYLLYTVSKFNNVRVKFKRIQGDTDVWLTIDHIVFKVDYSSDASQEFGDYYKINLGTAVPRVCGVIVQSRGVQSYPRAYTDQYPRHYKVEVGTVEDAACGEQTEGDGGTGIPLGNIVIAGPWEMPSTDVIHGVYANLDTNSGEKIKGVIYRKEKEDFGGYSETDPNSHISPSGNHVDFDAYENEDAYLRKDYGANYFGYFFEHFVDVKVVTDPVPDPTGYSAFYPCYAVSTAVDDLLALEFGANDVLSVSIFRDVNNIIAGGAPCFRFSGNWSGGGYTTYSSELTEGTTYYLKIRKDGTDCKLYIYTSASDRIADTNRKLGSPLTVTLNTSAKYRYVFSAITYNSGYNRHCDLDIDNLMVNLELMGTGAQMTVLQSGIHWEYLPVGTSLNSGDVFYMGFCQDVFTPSLALRRTDSAGKDLYNKVAWCNPPDPYGEPIGVSNKRWSIFCVYGGDYQTIVEAQDNCAIDLVHSWTPQSVQFIRIKLTGSDSEHGWSISQVYVYQADDADYCVLDDGGGAYQYLTLGTIYENKECSDGDCLSCLKPMNVPFGRLINNLEKISLITHDAYDPWEWWIELTDTATAKIYFGGGANKKGSDKSAYITFKGAVELGGTGKSYSIKQSAQRVRVTASKSGKRQDIISSNWMEDTAAMSEINTFYEELRSERSVTNRDAAQEWARLYRELLKDPLEDITIEVQDFPENEDWDVGDTVTVEDTKTGITLGSYRLNGLHYRISGGTGEQLSLVVSSAKRGIKKDVTDKIAELYRRIKLLEISDIDTEEWAVESKKEATIDTGKLDDPWGMSRKYEETTELQDIDPDNQDTYEIGGEEDGCDVKVNKDKLTLRGNDVGPEEYIEPCIATVACYVWVKERRTSWKNEPKFKAKLMITRDFPCDGDYLYFGMGAGTAGTISVHPPNKRGFGFKIIKEAGTGKFLCYAWARDGDALVERIVAILAGQKFYEFEAKTDWEGGYVFFYVNSIPRAVIEINDEDETKDMVLMWCYLLTHKNWEGADDDTSALVDFYNWSTQVKIIPEMLGEIS